MENKNMVDAVETNANTMSETPSGFKVIWRELRHDKVAMISLVIAATLLIGITVWGSLLNQDKVTEASLLDRFLAPGQDGHILGADPSGRDVWNYLMLGGRNSILIGVSVTLITEFIGLIIGTICGYFGGLLDNVVMRIVDFFMIIPTTLVIILLVKITTHYNAVTLVLIISAFGWMGTTRLMRSLIFSQASRDYIAASKTSGTSNFTIMWRELIPNISSMIITDLTLGIAGNIGLEVGLSYLGFGLPPDTPSLGTMIAYANDPDIITAYPWVWLPASLLIMVLALSISFFGNAIRRAADARQRT